MPSFCQISRILLFYLLKVMLMVPVRVSAARFVRGPGLSGLSRRAHTVRRQPHEPGVHNLVMTSRGEVSSKGVQFWTAAKTSWF